MIDFLYLIGGFILLILAGNWLLKGSVDLAARIGLSRIIIGLTVVSFATSAPELIVSVNAAISGSSDISLGNIIGSNIANIGLVLGITILISPIIVSKKFIQGDWLILMIISSIFSLFLWFGHGLSRWEGFIFVLILIGYLYFLLKKKDVADVEIEEEINENQKFYIILFYLLIGGVGLWLGSDLLVNGAKNIAQDFGVSESVIGLTVVAIGTSVPELAASIIAVTKGEKSISFGNLIGSNIFNILSVLGITSIIQPINVNDDRFLTHDIWWMLGFSFILLPFILVFNKRKLGIVEGIILLALYTIYISLAL